MNNNSAVTTFNTKNSAILSDTVFSVLMVRNNLRWFGTSKGISATFDNKWLTPAYHKQYPESLFKSNRITDLATTLSGDTLYVATEGAGVARVYIDKVDAISGASEYAIWGPIEMPSDKVYSLCITNDGTQWLGTDLGAARHTGYNTLENWTIFNTENGLIDNFVQAIAADNNGKLWFGTKGGLSVFDGTVWTSYTTADGLISNNILCIFTHANGTVYLGTDAGLMIYNNGHLVCYKSTLN
jgi:ligand-binding sensor domain-containing protein